MDSSPYVSWNTEGWHVVECDGCFGQYDKTHLTVNFDVGRSKVVYHILDNLEYLEWVYEKRLAL